MRRFATREPAIPQLPKADARAAPPGHRHPFAGQYRRRATARGRRPGPGAPGGPLQEAVQPEGNRDWRGVLAQIARAARSVGVPIVAKEVGPGLSSSLACALVDAGVAVIDVAGAGGTSWAAIPKSPDHMVLMYDEYGHFEGVFSSGDIMEAIMGALQDGPVNETAIPRREDGSYLVSGWMPIYEFADMMSLRLDDDIDFQTVAGLVVEELKHLRDVGESSVKNGWRFEVVDLDGRRIDKMLVRPHNQMALTILSCVAKLPALRLVPCCRRDFHEYYLPAKASGSDHGGSDSFLKRRTVAFRLRTYGSLCRLWCRRGRRRRFSARRRLRSRG